jgi:hypothetical protein
MPSAPATTPFAKKRASTNAPNAAMSTLLPEIVQWIAVLAATISTKRCALNPSKNNQLQENQPPLKKKLLFFLNKNPPAGLNKRNPITGGFPLYPPYGARKKGKKPVPRKADKGGTLLLLGCVCLDPLEGFCSKKREVYFLEGVGSLATGCFYLG